MANYVRISGIFNTVVSTGLFYSLSLRHALELKNRNFPPVTLFCHRHGIPVTSHARHRCQFPLLKQTYLSSPFTFFVAT